MKFQRRQQTFIQLYVNTLLDATMGEFAGGELGDFVMKNIHSMVRGETTATETDN